MQSECVCHPAVDEAILAGDSFSNTVLQDYSSVTAHVNVSIDNSAWYPDLGSAANATHDWLVDELHSKGFSVVRAHSATALLLEFQMLYKAGIQQEEKLLA